MKSLALALFLALSLRAQASELRLTNGTTFQDWSVIGQTDDSVTIKHSKGGAKVKKSLLPPDVLAQFPAVEAPPAAPLPPEPFNLSKQQRGQRSITGTHDLTSADLTWTVSVTDRWEYLIRRNSSPKDKLFERKMDYFFALKPNELQPLYDALEKVNQWADAVKAKRPPPFEKSMGQVLGNEWKFKWTTLDRVEIWMGRSGAPLLELADVEKLQMLIVVSPYVAREKLEDSDKAEEFAASLK